MPTIRPIIFSCMMACAFMEDRKTQTRRLDTSPLAKCEIGDLLWVRESFAQPFKETDRSTGCIFRADGPEFTEGLGSQAHQWGANARWTPAIHMPRKYSRITLRVLGKRLEALHDISEADAMAEGGMYHDGRGRRPSGYRHDYGDVYPTARDSFTALWQRLHNDEGSRWEDNPNLVVLTLEVIKRNVDRLAAPCDA